MMQPLPPLPELPERQHNSWSDAMYDIADVLQFPVDNRGRVYDVRFLLPALSYHLARAGCVVDPSRAIIKQRRLPPAPGVMEGAVEWVSVNEPDTVDDELADTPIGNVDNLSPAARAELIRRLGGTTTDENDTGWHVQTHIVFEDDQEEM